jgi:hypothetical protein
MVSDAPAFSHDCSKVPKIRRQRGCGTALLVARCSASRITSGSAEFGTERHEYDRIHSLKDTLLKLAGVEPSVGSYQRIGIR